MKTLIKRVLSLTPYRVLQGPPNRFDAIEDTLKRLARCNYRPTLIVDGGAHLGSFATMAAAIFPSSKMPMFEPQPSGSPALATLAANRGFAFSPVALGAERKTARLWAGASPGTGASIATEEGDGQVVIEVSTLDLELSDTAVAHNSMLKLDLQGYEMEALKGAAGRLRAFEVILSEVSFFAQAYEPSPLELISYLDRQGFQLLDVCALAGRRRDGRLKQGDLLFARSDSALMTDTRWE